MQFTILIIDDERNIREGLGAALELDGYNVKLAENGEQGLALMEKGDIDLVITDLRMPGISGEQVIAKVKGESPGIPVIVLTGHGSIDSAVDAMRNGAYDFLTKPLNIDRLSLIVKRALAGRELEIRHSTLKEELDARTSFESIIGKSAEMQKIFEVVRKTAASKASVLITGESGTGKELIANALHNLSPRRNQPFIKVHCAALSESLLESELFGHEKGAFTGAVARKRGRFELANTGTIFLDEIGEIDQNVQIKILRVLQDKRFERVGGEETLEVDVRVIAATNRNLEEEIAAHRFREDLYYRLNVVPLQVPPLRERPEDILPLASLFVQKMNRKYGYEKKLTPNAEAQMRSYSWPGNIRELRNVIERAVILSTSDDVEVQGMLPPVSGTLGDQGELPHDLPRRLRQLEYAYMKRAYELHGSVRDAARALGMKKSTFAEKLQIYMHQYENQDGV